MAGSAPMPPVRSREQWGAEAPTGPLRHTTVTHIFVHHTESPNDTADWEEKVRFIQRLHMDKRRWHDIAYNYLIDPEGTVYEGRAGGCNVAGRHCRGLNEHTMSVALLGTYDRAAPSEKAISSLVALLGWTCARESIDPLAVTRHATSDLELHTISGHRDGDPARTCPGEAAYQLLPAIRKRVAGVLSKGSDQ